PATKDNEIQHRRNHLFALVQFLRHRGLLPWDVEPDAQTALRASLEYLSQGPARMVLVNLEDLWLETRPQNVPGTWLERPNWRRQTRLSLEELRRDAEAIKVLRRINELVRQA